MDEYLEVRWNEALQSLKETHPEDLTNSRDLVYALPITNLRRSGRRDGEGVKVMDFVYRYVSSYYKLSLSFEFFLMFDSFHSLEFGLRYKYVSHSKVRRCKNLLLDLRAAEMGVPTFHSVYVKGRNQCLQYADQSKRKGTNKSHC